MRGDLQAELVDFDTWCPMAGYRELKLFLAYAVFEKCRIYQIDFIGAFLHAVSRNKTYTVLPEEWRWDGAKTVCHVQWKPCVDSDPGLSQSHLHV